jgi:hypothetical protein
VDLQIWTDATTFLKEYNRLIDRLINDSQDPKAWHNTLFVLQQHIQLKDGVWCCPQSPLHFALLDQSDSVDQVDGSTAAAYCLWTTSTGSNPRDLEIRCFHRDLDHFKSLPLSLEGLTLTNDQKECITNFK